MVCVLFSLGADLRGIVCSFEFVGSVVWSMFSCAVLNL